MISFVSEEIQNYADAHSTPEPEVFAELARATIASEEDHRMMVGHCEGMLLRLLVRMTAARRVLEVGTFTGYSALAMAHALPDDGRIITCDIDPRATALAQRCWDLSPHGRKVTLKLAPALDTIATITEPIDLAFIDADKINYVRYWDAILPRLRTGGVIVADNVLWSGRVLDPKEKDDHAIVAFNVHVKQDARVEHVMLPVRDGITIAVKR